MDFDNLYENQKWEKINFKFQRGRKYSMDTLNAKNELIAAITSLYEYWNTIKKKFQGERWRNSFEQIDKNKTDYLDAAFIDELKIRLHSCQWDIRSEVKLSNVPSTWSKFDVGCYYNGKLIGLIELAVNDSNVAHALHNGEVKLLGICKGLSMRDRHRDFAHEFNLDDSQTNYIRLELSKIPVRGLFYTMGDGLYKKNETKWFITKAKGYEGETKYHSALFEIGAVEDLATVFRKLNDEGLYTWYL